MDTYRLKKAVVIALLFTLFDFILHAIGFEYFPQNSLLPDYYYLFKIIGATIFFLIIYNYKEGWENYAKAGLLAFLLQIRYYLTIPYSINTNLVMVIVHFILIFASIKSYERYIE